MWSLALTALSALTVCQVYGSVISYEPTKDDEKKMFRPVMIPVSSTVIPLDDLPVYKVGFGFTFSPKEQEKAVTEKAYEAKVEPKKKHELITAKKKKKYDLKKYDRAYFGPQLARPKRPFSPKSREKEAYVPRFNYAKIQELNEEQFKRWKPNSGKYF
ncbi:unnamed protein product [Cyprideis torosa]|uniref:Uncharacterized protein n=1 Tax=Cyprideis torosa TaxID=163714 RepID=A0A7R8WH15_9CRUS|nr:unnamed protein product [Cyprideis torosa]CAG0892359.1 unnamed protein product [Cyprideis torosa]